MAASIPQYSLKPYVLAPNPKDFTAKELSLFDVEAFTRHFLTINWKKVTENEEQIMHDIIRHQYYLPMKCIECVNYVYRSCKRYHAKITNDENENEDYLYIEPINNNYPIYIKYIPINQSLPLDTNCVIDIDMEKSKTPQNYYFLKSSSIKTDDNIESVILKENPKSVFKRPWPHSIHIGSLDIDSKLFFKGKVAYVNTEVCNSLTLFGFRRDDDNNVFTIFTYDCFNITPKTIFELLLTLPDIKPATKQFCNDIIKKLGDK